MNHPHPSRATRRSLACCFLAVAWALANWGAMALTSVLVGWLFTAWWASCAGFAMASVVLASMDVLDSVRSMRAEQRRTHEELQRELDAELSLTVPERDSRSVDSKEN